MVLVRTRDEAHHSTTVFGVIDPGNPEKACTGTAGHTLDGRRQGRGIEPEIHQNEAPTDVCGRGEHQAWLQGAHGDGHIGGDVSPRQGAPVNIDAGRGIDRQNKWGPPVRCGGRNETMGKSSVFSDFDGQGGWNPT